MGAAAEIYTRRKSALERLRSLAKQRHRVWFIHYSCESFYDQQIVRSRRVTSIVVGHWESGQSTAFSLSHVAEERKIELDASTRDEILDNIEAELLHDFYSFVRQRPDIQWVHWNMRDFSYGFEALSHRARVLNVEPVLIPNSSLHDLASVLTQYYGDKYCPDPRLENLARINDVTLKDFKTGAEESELYQERNFSDLLRSTQRKVRMIQKFSELFVEQRLKTAKSWFVITRTDWIGRLDSIVDHWSSKLLGLIGVLSGLVALLLAILDLI